MFSGLRSQSLLLGFYIEKFCCVPYCFLEFMSTCQKWRWWHPWKVFILLTRIFPNSACVWSLFNEFVSGFCNQFRLWVRWFNDRLWSSANPSRCLAQSLDIISLNTMVYPNPGASTSGNGSGVWVRQRANQNGSGSSFV